MNYYAHSTENMDKSDWQPLSEHLLNVAEMAERFASVFGADEWGKFAGLFHDAGKATKEFIARLEGLPKRVDHVTFGARLAKDKTGKLGFLLSYAIAGHHGGIPDGGLQEEQLHFRIQNGKVADDTCLVPEVDVSSDLKPPFLLDPKRAMFSLAFFTRMVFSCLVDADFLDTERFCSPEKTAWRNWQCHIDLSNLQHSLQTYLLEKEQEARPGKVNALRKSILNHCRTNAPRSQGFFSLTVPTGGGKTLSSLAFAIDHAVHHKLARIIYAIPFTSIIEQNAQIFREAIGNENVLEHHCNYREKDDESHYDKWRSLSAENWNAPIVVTTNVQFFESLYSNKTSRCRKLHNIAGSVIILDEAQTIPTEYLEPCLAVLRELVAYYRCTVLLCTATQPALDDTSLVRSALPNLHEIIDNTEYYYKELKRVQVDFIGKLTNEALAGRLNHYKQVLCIVSTKKQAQQVFNDIEDKDGAYHLSTNMHPAHRFRVLKNIKKRLLQDLPCRVVATSLVEAGVDLDFPVVYRAMAGLDSIAQAAGRCNREGRMEYGCVYVYEPDEMPAMPWLRRRISRAQETLRLMQDEDVLGLNAMRKYFELLYDVEGLDVHDIVSRLNPKLNLELILPFREVAQDFRMISDEGVGVIIPENSEVIDKIGMLRGIGVKRSILQTMQQYSVNVRKKTLFRLVECGAVEMIRDRYPVLRNMAGYNEMLGLVVDMAEIWEPEAYIV